MAGSHQLSTRWLPVSENDWRHEGIIIASYSIFDVTIQLCTSCTHKASCRLIKWAVLAWVLHQGKPQQWTAMEECWDVRNLYVADAAVMPTSTGAEASNNSVQNP